MDERQKEKDFEKVFTFLGGIGLGAFFLVMYLYLLRFWRYEFSPDPARWAEFGEYIGGTLGGIFGLLAFIGVLITIVQQRTQINLMRSQFTREELLRLAANAWKAADEVLNQECDGIPWPVRQQLQREGEGPVTVHHLLVAAGRMALQPQSDHMIDGHHVPLLTHIRSALGLDASIIALELDRLAECLLIYRETDGNPDIEGIYRGRAGPYAACLEAAGFPCKDRVKSYFSTDVGKEP